MEIKKLENVNLADNVVKMDSVSELDEAISQAVNQKVQNLDSVIEQKAGEATQAMLSSAAFKDAIDGILRQYGLLSAENQIEDPTEDPAEG